MPSQVVIVKRVRRRSFAMLLAIPGWLRAAWSAVRGESPGVRGALGVSEADLPREIGVPNLRVKGEGAGESEGAHACTACGICLDVCPSAALELEAHPAAPGPPLVSATARTDSAPADLMGFALDLGRCIACGRCAEACPEQALGLAPMPAVALVGRSGRPLPIDLLEGVRAGHQRVGA